MREGKSPTAQAGEFVREEIHQLRAGKHGARNAKQAIAIGLSKARRVGVKLPPPKGAAFGTEDRRRQEFETVTLPCAFSRHFQSSAPRRALVSFATVFVKTGANCGVSAHQS